MSEWISVEKRLPKNKEYPVVMVSVDKTGYTQVDASFGETFRYHEQKITHWMSLPKPPKD
jgi:hypothetical protein